MTISDGTGMVIQPKANNRIQYTLLTFCSCHVKLSHCMSKRIIFKKWNQGMQTMNYQGWERIACLQKRQQICDCEYYKADMFLKAIKPIVFLHIGSINISTIHVVWERRDLQRGMKTKLILPVCQYCDIHSAMKYLLDYSAMSSFFYIKNIYHFSLHFTAMNQLRFIIPIQHKYINRSDTFFVNKESTQV